MQAVLPPFIDIGSRITEELNNPKYNAGEVSPYAKEPEGGSRTGGSNSSANNGQGGQGSEGSSIFNIIIDFVVDLVTLNIFTEEELNAPVYKSEGFVTYADREQVLPEANW
ncbi:MAG: hypothetical protein KIT33_00470 [Candidatus Kapabacteria bacterium]|nr:hypothetical protein [Ignavibacteriota bacterium]MCW5883422.1 hypothetical protein [Candidatus Kapabacteria bacterium]